MQMSSGDSQLWANLEKSGKRQKERKTMEKKLIIAVSGFPELLRTLWTQMDRRQRALRFHRKYADATRRRLPRVRSMVKEGTDVMNAM